MSRARCDARASDTQPFSSRVAGMLTRPVRKHSIPFLLALCFFAAPVVGQTAQQPVAPTHANILRGEYGRYRANNDLLAYHLDIRIDPEKKFVGGKNTIRFRMLKDDNRIQLDLYDNLKIDKIALALERDG